MIIRDIEAEDIQSVVALNTVEVANTSPMSAERLQVLMGYSFGSIHPQG